MSTTRDNEYHLIGRVEKGWANLQSLELMSRALKQWSQHPDGLFAQAWCEVVGYK